MPGNSIEPHAAGSRPRRAPRPAPAARTAQASRAAAGPCPPTSGPGTRATPAPRTCPQDRPQAGQGAPGRGGRGPGAQDRHSRARKDTTVGPRRRPGHAPAGRLRSAAASCRTAAVPRIAPGPPVQPDPGRSGAAARAQPGGRGAARAVPATALYVAQGIDIDDRITEIVRTAGDRGIPILEISRNELDRMTGGVLHQGVGLQVPPFAYETFDDLLAASLEQTAPLLVALDGVTDPRNLGAVIRSVAAFGAHGVFIPERRAAGITATAWRTSAGAAARVPVVPGHQPDPRDQGVPAGRLHRGRAGRRRRDRPLRPGGGGRPAGGRGRLRGPRPVPAGRRDLRPAGQHPDGVRGGVAERQRRRRGHAGRGRPASYLRLTSLT